MDLINIYKKFRETNGVTTDSRESSEGYIFFALKGEQFNGNKYAEDALRNGCKYAIVDEEKWVKDERYILVEDVLYTLQQLAQYHRQQMHAKILAITGSNGKTTTKELINKVLSSSFHTLTNIKNFNNHIGVPLTLLNLKKEHEIAIIEMGANHQGEIDFLCKIADPGFGIITNIGKAHLEGFGSFEGVKKTKGELYDYLDNKEGVIFYNSDNALLTQMAKRTNCTLIDFGTESNTSFHAHLIDNNPYLQIKADETVISTQLIGKYNFENALASFCIGKYFGLSTDKIKKAIEEYKPENNRSQVIETNNNKIILDAYNANPTSMLAAIENFIEMTGKNKTLILGDMFELGEKSKEEHNKIIEFIDRYNFKEVFLVGEIFYEISPEKYKSFSTTEAFLNYIRRTPISHQNILVKGSRGMQLEKTTQFL
jgi:UDP-N-acetylmuramoyl-tripeptide--D-alanyl-D-alanine ligase